MTKRMISPKTFLTKSNQHLTDAADFLKKNRDFLTDSPVSVYTKSIMDSIDRVQYSPEIGLVKLQQAVVMFMLEDAKVKANKPRNTRQSTPKDFIATILDANGSIAYDDFGKQLQTSFNSPSEASGWVERKLDSGNSTWYGTVQHPVMINDSPMVTVIGRVRAIANQNRKGKTPVMNKTRQSAPLTSTAKCKGDHFHFSRG